MSKFLKALFNAFIDPLAVVTMITTVGTIAGVLAYATPRPTYLTIGFCVAIAVLGTLTVVYQVRRLYRQYRAREAISGLLAMGKQITQETNYMSTPEHIAKLQEWCEQVEAILRLYKDESYVLRFQLEGNDVQDSQNMSKWKMNRRLSALMEFLKEPQ